MRKIFLLTAVLCLPSFCLAAQDCAKNAEACSASSTRAVPASPFLAASRAAAQAPAPAAKPAAQAVKPAAAEAKPAVAAVPAAENAVPAAENAVPAPAEAPVQSAPAMPGMSSPAWLLFVIGGVAGLYFYLRSGSRRGKRK